MLAADTKRFFVITGGPGSGKTTLLDCLKAEGAAHIMSEAGRAVIQSEVTAGGDALPWADRAAFAELMFVADAQAYRIATTLTGPVLFDRGAPDVIGYLRLSNLPVPSHIEAAGRLFRYAAQVFIAPPWKDIYEADEERKQSFDEAVATYDVMAEVYRALDYELVELPRSCVKQRMAFVMKVVASA